MPDDRYTHGHHRSVVTAHATRTIANSARYLEPYLTPGLSLIDVGCGPGTITAELAERLHPGPVLGIDRSEQIVGQARETFAESEARFEVMDIYRLDVEDDAFDIAHAHQVLQHLSDPVAALVEMRRVVRPGGLVAVRDADYAAMHWAPHSPEVERWLELYRAVARANDAEPDAGRRLVEWAREAGYSTIDPSVDTWLFATPERRRWWASTWAERIVASDLADRAVELGLAQRDELERLAEGWLSWSQQRDGWFVVVHGELVCRV